MGSRGVGLGGKTNRTKTVKLPAPRGESLGGTLLQDMENWLNKEGTDLAKQVYSKLMGELSYGGADPAGGAYYQPYARQVFFSRSKVANGNIIYKPYEIAFHEFGHAIDGTLRRSWGGPDHHSRKAVSRDLLTKEYEAFKKKMGFKSNTAAFNYFVKKYPESTCNTLSDALEGVTLTAHPLGSGHGVAYHKQKGKTETEFYANVLSTQAANPEGYKLLKAVFPKSVAAVEKSARDILKNY